MFPWSGTPEERMVSEIEAELSVYEERCKALHDEFRQKLRKRDEARAALSEAEEKISTIQMEGVALLGNLNAAMSEGDEERIQELERDYKRNNRDLVRTQKARDAAARKLETVEVADEKAVSGLKKDVLAVLAEYAGRVQERKQRLAGLMAILDKNHETLSRDTAPLTGGPEPRPSPEELPAAEESKKD